MKKKILTSCCFAILTFQSWASQDFPVQTQADIDVPPSPIDGNLFLLGMASALFVANFFYKYNHSQLKKEI